VKLYGLYLSLIKKLGWENAKENLLMFIFNQKLVHIAVALVTIMLFSVNFTAKTRAEEISSDVRKTILADLVSSEFGDYGAAEEDGQLVVETFDQEPDISPAQQTYLDNLTALKPQPKATMGEEEEPEEIQTIQEGTSIVKKDLAATQKIKRPRNDVVTYTVKPGDSISTIAEEFEISVNTVLWENNLSAYSVIKPGQELSILPFTGVKHEIAKGENLSSIAKKYKVGENVILEANKLASADTLKIGEKLLIPGGEKVSYASYQPASYRGISAIKDFVKTPNAVPIAGNKMNWPTAGNRITQYYSWRHLAVDIANKIGTPIYAADAGTIEYVGWGTGYGNQIVIDHGGGKKTRYAHLSKFYISKGERVGKGQTIGAMGSTGWSTGPHLHFEVVINGKKYNPLNYIK